jgi:hypothetical protein
MAGSEGKGGVLIYAGRSFLATATARLHEPHTSAEPCRRMGLAMWKYVLAWFPMVFMAVTNGALREGWYGKYLSELQAHQVSTATGVLLFGVYIWALLRLWRLESAGQAMTIGLVWLGLTVAFECLFGHHVAKRPWRDLLHDYNLVAGHVWLVVLVWVTIAPYLFCQLQR